MQKFFSLFLAANFLLMLGCQPETASVSTNRVEPNVNPANSSSSNANANASGATLNPTITETKEPDRYQATVKLKLQATGSDKTTDLPAISANVARSGADRRMEFNLPNGDKVLYIDKAGATYLVLPNRKQYAVLDKQSVGFEVRQLMMPGEIVNQVKAVKGVERVGEETINGRQVVKYRYGAVSDTRTNAGQVATESYFLIDKETGLPIRSETVSQTGSGNAQGFNGLRVVTEMSNIKTETTPELFAVPEDFQKIDAAQVKSQVELIFNAVGLLLNRALNSPAANQNSNINSNMSNSAK